MSRTNKVKDTASTAKKAVESIYRRKPNVPKQQHSIAGEHPVSWRAGLDQSAVSGLQVPRFMPGDPSPFLKNFQALTDFPRKLMPTNDWAKDIAKSCGNFLKEAIRIKDNAAFLWSNCRKYLGSFSAVTSVEGVPPAAAALQDNACCLFRACSCILPSEGRQKPILTILPTETKITPLRRGKTTLIQSDNGIQIRLTTTGYKRENITVEVEGNWLVIEALSTTTAEGGGYLQRHMMRRYELPPQADLRNISVELDERRNQLRVTVPSVTPKVTFT